MYNKPTEARQRVRPIKSVRPTRAVYGWQITDAWLSGQQISALVRFFAVKQCCKYKNYVSK